MAGDRERTLFRALKALRDALWHETDGENVGPRLNRAYMRADALIRSIESEKAQPKQEPTDAI